MTPQITFLSTLPEDDRAIRVVVTGHMVDRESRPQPRFPAQHIGRVQATLGHCLDQLAQSCGPLRVITSATKGVDLLAVAYAIETGTPAEIYLPQGDEASFLAGAVNYGPDGLRWVEWYEQAKASATIRIHTPVLATDPTRAFLTPETGTTQHYEDLNLYMAGLLRPQDALVAYWDGKQGDKPGGTEHMIRVAQSRRTRYYTLNTGLKNTDPRYDPLRLCYTFLEDPSDQGKEA